MSNNNKKENTPFEWRQSKQKTVNKVFAKGSSIAAVIPADVTKLLDIGEGDAVVYFKDEKHKVALIINANRVRVSLNGIGPAGLPFSIPKEIIEKIAPNLQKG